MSAPSAGQPEHIADEDRRRTGIFSASGRAGARPTAIGAAPVHVASLRVLLLLTAALRPPGSSSTCSTRTSRSSAPGRGHQPRGKLYEEAADRKPPLVPYLYAATFALFGTTALWSVRVIAMLAVALTCVVPRARSSKTLWRPGRVDRRRADGAGVGRSRAGRSGGELRDLHVADMTAAVLLARRGRAFSSGAAVALAAHKQTGARRCCRSSTSCGGNGPAGATDAFGGSRCRW